jgi:hypothetical protein
VRGGGRQSATHGTNGSWRWEPIGLESLLRLGRCRVKQRKWFGPGKRF